MLLKLGVCKHVKVVDRVPRLVVTPTREFIKGIKCRKCGGRFLIESVYTCRACFYGGKKRIVGRCVKCGQEQEMWLTPDGALWQTKEEAQEEEREA